jgi:hypothetical protein
MARAGGLPQVVRLRTPRGEVIEMPVLPATRAVIRKARRRLNGWSLLNEQLDLWTDESRKDEIPC